MASFYSSVNGVVLGEPDKKKTKVVSNSKQVIDDDDSWDEDFDPSKSANRFFAYVPGQGRDWVGEADQENEIESRKLDIKNAPFI